MQWVRLSFLLAVLLDCGGFGQLYHLVIASFTSGPSSTTLPIKIFSAVRLGVSPEINALSTIMIGIVAVGVISASLITKRTALKREREERQAGR